MMKQYIQLLRPLQWLKNGFVFAPTFFSNNLLKWEYLHPTLIVFFSFCFISSAIYCFNDLHDIEADRQHPKKCKRPIASGAVSKKAGYTLMALCTGLAFVVLGFIESAHTPILFVILASYWLMNIAYCLRLKQTAIIDVTIIAVGFVMRVVIGGMATDVWVSQWLVLMTFLVTLLLALAKRNDDFRIYEQTGVKPRKSITGYNHAFINETTSILASITIVCYIMYTMSEDVNSRFDTNYLYLTSAWVILGIFRYLQNMIVLGRSGSPTKTLVRDRFLRFCLLGWIASFFAIIYL